jgi:hypothetical protein
VLANTLPEVVGHLQIFVYTAHEFWSQDNKGERDLPRKFVRNSYYASIDHIWMAQQMTLELGRGYLITFHFDKFLQCNKKLSIGKIG